MNNMNKQDGNKDKEKEKARNKMIHDVACIFFAFVFLYMFYKDDPGLLTKALAFWSNLFH